MIGGNRARTNSTQAPLCSSWSILGAFIIILATYRITQLLIEVPLSSCNFPVSYTVPNSPKSGVYKNYGSLAGVFGQYTAGWPERGYGTHLSLHIYVYEVDEIDGLKQLLGGRAQAINSSSCMKGQWGTQAKIHKLLLESRYRTLDKTKADFFFVPSYVKCVRMKGGLTDTEINATYLKVVKQMPYFRRSGGRDHLFVFPSGAGAHLVKDWVLFLNRSIFLTPEGDRTDKRSTSSFNTWKDIIIPGNVDNGIPYTEYMLNSVIRPLPLGKRKFVANFLGRAQAKQGRLQLIELGKQFPNELDAPVLEFRGPGKLDHKEYWTRMRNAKFCLAPRGESSWTVRLYEAFFVECVPVILSDEIELPFQNVLDYSEFTIKWPSSRIDEDLLQYLRSIPDFDIERMIERGRAVRCLWVYAPESEGCTAMTGILWELQRKVRVFHQSPDTFWIHNSSVLDRNLLPLTDWIPPLA